MKILHVLETMAPAYGGPVQALRIYADWLSAAGDEVVICTTNRDIPAGTIPGPTNAPIQQDGYTLWRFETTFQPYAYSIQMGRWLRENVRSFDLLHIHGLYRYPPIAAARYAKASGVPYIMRPFGSLDPYLYNKAERRSFKRLHEFLFDFPALNGADAVHFTTDEECQLVAPLGLKPPTAVIPVGLDAGPFDRPDLDGRMRAKLGIGKRPMILFFGRLTPKKGLDISIRAFAACHAKIPDAVFVIAGPDNDNFRPQVEKWLAENCVKDATILVGMTKGDDRIALLRDADLFVLQSHTENFGISVVESLAAGTPVVISDKVNLWPDIAEYNAGAVTPCDSDQAALAMIRILEDVEVRGMMVQGGRRLLSEKYCKEAVTRQLQKLYCKICNQPMKMRDTSI